MSTSYDENGINIVGHLGSSSGLGNTARSFANALQKNGYKIAGLNLEYDGSAEQHADVDFPVFRSATDLPYRNNLIIPSINLLSSIWRNQAPELLNPRFRNAGLIFWELPVIPPAWKPCLQLFDVFLTSSQFVRSALELALPEIPSIHAEYPLLPHSSMVSGAAVREELGIPSSSFVCFTSFDLRSELARKNPFASVQAFIDAFPSDDDVRLIVKMNSGNTNNYLLANSSIQSLLGSDQRIKTISKTLDYSEVLDLYACADLFISLHRSEGLGLGPMEAMAQGVLAVCTGYSGNMEYMNATNSEPVPYRLTSPENVPWLYTPSFVGANAYWAEADQTEAAKKLRNSKKLPDQRLAVASRGQRDINERQQWAWKMPYIPLMLRYLRESEGYKNRQKILRNVYLQEIKDPTLLKRNIKYVTKRITSLVAPSL